MDYKYIDKKKCESTWEDLLLAADSDFVAFILLSHCGIGWSTSLWMAGHSIEKYMKSVILKNKKGADIRKYSHKLEELLKEMRGICSSEENEELDGFEDFIRELNMENRAIELRYSFVISMRVGPFMRMYTILACVLRRIVLGKEEYESRGVFGLAEEFSFGGPSMCTQEEVDVKGIVCPLIDGLLSK